MDLKGSERGANGRLPGEERRRRPRPMPVRCTEPSGGTGGGWWTASWRCESLMRICPSRWSELPTRSRVPSSLESMCSAEASLPVVLIPWGRRSKFAIEKCGSAAPAQITPGTPPAILIFGVWGVWGSPPGLAPQARNFWAFALLLITKHRAAYCNAPYTHAHCTSKIRARFSSVAFATYLRSVGAAPARSLRGRHWGVPTKACDHGPPQARDFWVCVRAL